MKWDDGTLYEGVFRNRYISTLLTVELTSKQYSNHLPNVVTVKREAVFARGERPAEAAQLSPS